MSTIHSALSLSDARARVRAVLAACSALLATPLSAAQLPVVCVAGSCGVNGPVSWLGSGQATATAVGNTLTILQQSEQAVLNWSSFNVSADGKVIFKQPDAAAIALNQIFQASPSQIFGLVKANGQIYLINQNGIIFGSSAQVNVGGLLASSLQLTGPLSGGLFTALQKNIPALASDGRISVLDAAGNPVLGADGKPLPVQIVVQPGAQISTSADGERILLAGQSVTNGGSISAPNGQVILAAGQSAFIQASTDPNLRGLIVEVDSGGLAENQLQGSISVAEGNITLVGLAVNQKGRLSAKTSVSENGSIRLLARDTVTVQSVEGTLELAPSNGGSLTLGPQSQTSVLPDTASTATAIDQQAQPRSTITLAGKQVDLAGGSNVTAPSGLVSITASSIPSTPNTSTTPDPNAHLRIDSSAVIDVSGSTASVPVTNNLVTVQLRGSELANFPLQRNGALRGKTVVVDARVGTPLADVSGDIALIQRNVLQRTGTGGSITLDSGGDVVVARGATLNVSGGQVDYTPGLMQTSLLIKPDGSTVNIGSASPNQVYTGVVNPTFESIFNQWGVIQFIPTAGIAHYDPGYVQGASAGSVQILGSSLVLDGTFLGQAVNGIYQRSGSGIALGGMFSIGTTTQSNPGVLPDFRAPAVELVNNAPTVVVDPGASLPTDLPVALSTELLTNGGFTRLQIASNDRIAVPAGVSLDLGPGGSINFTAPQIDLNSSIKIPSGTIQLTASSSLNTPQGTPNLGIFVGNGVTLDASGTWTNDTLVPLDSAPTGLALVNAGSIQLAQNVFQGTLSIGSDDQFLANGGAQLQRGGGLSSGKGGSIGLVGSPGGTVQVGNADLVQGFGVNGALGGSFTLEVPRIQISSGETNWLRAQSVDSDPASPAFFKIDASLFSNYGFSSFKLTADGPSSALGTTLDTLTVTPGTAIDLRTSTLHLNANADQQVTGSSLTGFATATLLPAYQRLPSQLTLQASPGEITQAEIGNLTVGAKASFTADPRSTITLASVGNLNFNGIIDSPSSTVNLEILSPAASFDPGFVPTLQIELGSTAEINVAGTAVDQPKDTGLLIGQVLAGGSVTLSAARGSVITEPGSVIDFSGTQAPMDLALGMGGTYQRQTVASAAGSLSIGSQESISLLGSYIGQPGMGTTGSAAGGTLNLTLSSLAYGGSPSGFPSAPLVITVQPGPLETQLAPNSGSAVLGASQLAASGIDAVNLTADDAVQFTNGVQLNLARSLTITAPSIGVASQGLVNVSAPYIALGSANALEAPHSALPGTGMIAFHGDAIDLIGSLAFQGVANATLDSTGEILLRGELVDANNTGSLSIAGDLTLSAARVVPTTAVNYTITASGGASNTVQFEQNGTLSGVPLSVAASLTVNAENIMQGGTIFAPFGQLTFSASDNLTFAPGSLTSVSGTATVLPYGEVQNGTSWVYQVSSSQLSPAAVTVLPNRQVTATGAKITLASNATIDVSGGGDLNAYEWTPGTGGTSDVLANTQTPGLYAVLPSLQGQTAPFDPMMWAGSNLTPNESVYLSGGGGLAAGVYPLLPARYALLPGAFLVSVASGYQDLAPGASAQAGNGFSIVSGYFTNGSTRIGDTRTSGFLLEPGSYAQSLANYTNNYASTFFAAAAANSPAPSIPSSPLPADAGTVLFSAQTGFDALGKVNGAAAQGGEGATIEIAAPQIEIDPAVVADAGAPSLIHLSSAVLDGWNAGRLWLGLESQANGSLGVTTSSVELTSGSKLLADEIILAATGSVLVDTGASLATASLANSQHPPLAASAMATPLTLGGTSSGAAVLVASDLTYWQPNRTGTSKAPATLVVANGASVGSRGSLIFDAPGGGTLADGTLSGSGAQWSIGTTNLVFGPQGSGAGGFALDDSLVGALQSAGTIRLASTAAINLTQPVNIGTAGGPAPAEIDIFAPAINNAAGSGTSSFNAGLITLTGGAGVAAASQSGSGSLSLTAREIDVEPGALTLSGFARTTLDASNVIVGNGSSALATAGDLSLLAPILTTSSGAQTQIDAGGNLTLGMSSRSSLGAAPVLTTGGSLALAGTTVIDNTLISMPSGEVSISATQQLTIANGAGINVAGVLPGNAVHGSDGGTIALNSGGALSVASGVSLSVAAGSGANAGSIAVAAAGQTDVEAQFDGSAAIGMRSGSFTLQAGSIPNFSSLNDALEKSGFHQTRSIEVANGDLDLAAGSSITAQNVALTADSGFINVSGTIDASSALGGGNIILAARSGLSLTSTATLAANGIGAGMSGGQIELAATAGLVQLDPASQVSANGAGRSGTLLVRAPQSATDVGIASLPSDLSHVGLVALEPMVAATLGSAPTAAQFAAIDSNLAGYMTVARPTILTRLGMNSTSNVVVRPYADLTSNGNLTLPSVDFSSWRFDGQPADISIRATGNLTVAGTLSDGFSTAPFLDVTTSPSARISLVAGANLSSASATAVTAGTAADLNLNPGAIVRTGTGALNLFAAHDVVFGKGASIYTGGMRGAASSTNDDTGVPLSFPTAGGNITVNAGRDVIGAPITEAVDQWNPRFQPNTAAIWGIDFQEFDWNIGALGGGNVMIQAGRNAVDITAAVADSRTFAADGITSIALGGGNLEVNTGNDVGSGLFYVGNGVGRINAGGALSSTLSDANHNALGTLLLAGDASYYISAQRDVLLQGIVSETALAPGPNSDAIFYFRYDPNSTLTVQSRGGSISYTNNQLRDLLYLGVTGATQSDSGTFNAAPPSIDLAAFGSDVIINALTESLPSSVGQLTVYAARDITSTGATLGMTDLALSEIATTDAPSALSEIFFPSTLSYTGASLHQNDPNPVKIAAGRDISDIGFDLPKQADISAGRDILSVTFAGQNLNPGDTTVIRAGRNIEYTLTDTTRSISLTGPGQLDVIAGGNIDLGLTAGITTYGNILNPNLVSSTGASISVLAGLGAPLGVGGSANSMDFINRVIAPSAPYQTMLVNYVEQLTGQSNVSLSSAEQTFRNFNIPQQLSLIENIFFNELVVSGQEANQVPSLGFGRGYNAIDGLFPDSRAASSAYSGNLTLGYSRIYTLDGGSISIMVPGGSINVGLANPPANFSVNGTTRTPSDLGIVAVGSGDVDIYSLGNVLVNQSRVFTLGGGDITIWSTLGNIDAGNGAKTSISAPPPTVQVDANGNVTLDFAAAVAGSGIRTIQSEPDVAAGNVNLIAPVGFVNAGDAGIGSAGNINIAAAQVIGATNINFGGTATGVPPEVSGIAASLSGAASVANSATTASSSSVENGGAQAAGSAPLASAALGWLDVFVEGFGEEVCKPNDIECLKRNHKSR